MRSGLWHSSCSHVHFANWTRAIYQNLTEKYKTKTVFWDSKQQALSQFSCIREEQQTSDSCKSTGRWLWWWKGRSMCRQTDSQITSNKLFTPHFRFPTNRKLGFGEKFRTPVNCWSYTSLCPLVKPGREFWKYFSFYDLIYKVSLGLKTKPRSTHGASPVSNFRLPPHLVLPTWLKKKKDFIT